MTYFNLLLEEPYFVDESSEDQLNSTTQNINKGGSLTLFCSNLFSEIAVLKSAF